MTGLLLSALLTVVPAGPASPSGVGLADSSATRNIRLVDDEVPNRGLDAMTRGQLVVELRRLDDERPGLGGPIAILAVGVALIIPGIGFGAGGLFTLIASLYRTAFNVASLIASVFLGVGVVMMGVGVVLAIVGGISLAARIRARTLNGREADQVRARMRAIDDGFPAPLPVPALAAPPSQANLVVPGSMQTVLTF